jgi:hypothetical protein
LFEEDYQQDSSDQRLQHHQERAVYDIWQKKHLGVPPVVLGTFKTGLTFPESPC